MIKGKELYNVMSAVLPLYFAMLLGYGAVRCWSVFTREQCSGVNRFVALFTVPLLSLDFVCRFNPYDMDVEFLVADLLSKALVLLPLLLLWLLFWKRASFDWFVSIFSITFLPSTLIVGRPLIEALYGTDQDQIIAQVVALQVLVWYPMLIGFMEIRKATDDMKHKAVSKVDYGNKEENGLSFHGVDLKEEKDLGFHDPELKVVVPNGTDHEGICKLESDLENGGFKEGLASISSPGNRQTAPKSWKLSDGPSNLRKWQGIITAVMLKLLWNPNVYASVIGLIWSLIFHRWEIREPFVTIKNCISSLSKAGSVPSMFSLGLFMASQPSIISCEIKEALFGMVLRFIIGPILAGGAAAMVGIRGRTLQVAIVQGALPQAISTFIFAAEYNLHAEIMSTMVSFGTMISLPVALAYYSVMELL